MKQESPAAIMLKEIRAGRMVRLPVPISYKQVDEPPIPHVFTERECREREETYDDRVSRALRRIKIW